MIIWEIMKHGYPEDRDQFNPFITLNVVFLTTLLAMHVIWFIMFQRVNLSILRKSQIEDKQYTCVSTMDIYKVVEESTSPASCSTSTSSEESGKEHSE